MSKNKPLPLDDATPKYQVIEHNGKPARLYPNGAIRNERGQLLVKPPFAAQTITSDTAHDMIAAREAKRRRLYAIGAQRAVQDTRLIEEFGADAHIVERAVTMQTLATTPNAGKVSVMAAAHLDKAQGLIGERVDSDAAQTVANAAAVGVAVASVMERVLRDVMQAQQGDVVDGEAADGG